MASDPNPHPPPGDRISGLVNIVKGLTISNVLVLAMLAIVAVPVYVIYRATNDPDMLDRIMSSYRELPTTSRCSFREFKTAGNSRQWSVTTGFAYQGNERWLAGVVLNRRPNDEEIDSYCTALKLITGAWEAAP